MRNETITIYKFDELNEAAKQKAIENFSDINVDYDWWDSVYDNFQEFAKQFGIEVDLEQTYFEIGIQSSFAATVDIPRLIEAIKSKVWMEDAPKIELNFPEVTPDIIRISELIKKGELSYDASVISPKVTYGVSVSLNWNVENGEVSENIKDTMEDVGEFFEDIATELNFYLYRMLRKTYIYLTSEEAIAETIMANEYEFTADGKQY